MRCSYNLPWGDFPSVDKYRAMLSEVRHFSSEFKRLDKGMIREMDKVMTVDIPRLLEAATAQMRPPPSPPPPPPPPPPTPQQQQQQQRQEDSSLQGAGREVSLGGTSNNRDDDENRFI